MAKLKRPLAGPLVTTGSVTAAELAIGRRRKYRAQVLATRCEAPVGPIERFVRKLVGKIDRFVFHPLDLQIGHPSLL
jgi:hypothetical protein